jgi:hypothetical protein
MLQNVAPFPRLERAYVETYSSARAIAQFEKQLEQV